MSQRGLHEVRNQESFQSEALYGSFQRHQAPGTVHANQLRRQRQIDGKDVYVLRGLGIDGKGERFYFDAQSGLLVRRITSTPTMVGLIPEQVDFSDYRDVDGMKMPFV